jgi:hypothetical protein
VKFGCVSITPGDDAERLPYVSHGRHANAWRRASQTMGPLSMGNARCNCGALTLSLPEQPSRIIVACHCIDCQRRTGAPFGVGAYYPAEVVTISGAAKEFVHAAASGGDMHNYFCPQCGSTVYWRVSSLPALIGVAVGAMANPKYPAPVISVFEQSKHDWVQIDGAEHFRDNYHPKNSH